MNFGEEVITVSVGIREKRYTVHKDVICETSEFFQAACANSTTEAPGGIFRVAEGTEQAFEQYMSWVYSNELDVSRDTETKHPSGPKYQIKNTQEFFYILRRLFIAFRVGEKLEDVAFRNAVVDEFVLVCAITNRVPPKKAILHLCQHESLKTTLASAFVDLVATRGDVMAVVNDDSHWPTEFMIKVAQACMRDRALSLNQRGPLNRGRCFYHEHGQGKGRTKFCSS